MVETSVCIIEEIDREWLQLIIEAKNMGIEKDEIRDYLINNGVKRKLESG